MPPANVTLNINSESLEIDTPIPLGGFHFVFQGDITPQVVQTGPSTTIGYDAEDDLTRLVLVAWNDLDYTESGPLLASGADHLISASAATHEGGKVNLSINRQLPVEYVLHQNFPNPFNHGTIISFETTALTPVTLDIYNLIGQLVYTTTQPGNAGRHDFIWLGKNTNGASLGSGVYYYRITSGDVRESKKMLLLK